MRSYDDFEEPQERASKRDRLPRTPPRRRAGEWTEDLRTTPAKVDHAALPMRKAIASEIQHVFRCLDDVQLDAVQQLLDARRHLMNHVSLTDLLNRLSAASLSGISEPSPELVSVGTRVLAELLSERVRPGPREITTAWRAVSSIGIKDPDLLDELARRTKRVMHAFETIDFAFAIAGLVSIARPSPILKGVLDQTLAMFQGYIPAASPDSLLSVLLALRRSGCTAPDLVQNINASLLEKGDSELPRLDVLTLKSMGNLVRCNAELRHDDPSVFSLVTDYFYRAFLKEKDGCRTLPSAHGAGDYVWAAAVFGYEVPQELLTALEKHIHEEISHLQHHTQRLISSIVAIPALLVSSGQPSEDSIKRFHDLEAMQRSKSADSSFERKVAAVLGEELGLAFEHEFLLGPYSLDFLVELPGERLVNIETDGDCHHLLWNVTTHTQETEYRGRDVVRDKVMRFFGVETVRVLASEWEAAQDKAQYLKQRLYSR